MPHPYPGTRLPESRFPWILVALLILLLGIVAIFLYGPRVHRTTAGPAGASVPSQPIAGQLELSAVTLNPSPPTSGARNVTLQGKVTNTSTAEVKDVQVQAKFRDARGAVIQEQLQRMQALEPAGRNAASANPEPLAQDPIKPGETKAFKIDFDAVPPDWNHRLPLLAIVNVNAPGVPGPTSIAKPEQESAPQPIGAGKPLTKKQRELIEKQKQQQPPPQE